MIVGLGISGIATAIALHKAGWTPVIIEKAPARRGGGYFIGMFGSGRAAAGRLGILKNLHNRKPIPSVSYEVDRAGRRRPGIGFADIPEGPWMVLRGDVERAAFDALPEDVEVHYATVPDAIEQDADGVTVTLRNTADESTRLERFDLVVGADGLRSTVRTLAFGPPGKYLHRLNCMIAAFALAEDLPGLARGEGAILAEPGRSFWVFPFADRPSTVLFSYYTDDVDAEFTKPVAERIREVYGPEPLGEMMEAAVQVLESGDEYLFDSVEQARLDRWHRGRVVLVGDAAWCVTLYAGMGATSGIAGADLLGAMLQRYPGDLERALTAWEQKLRPYVDAYQKSGVSNRLFFTPATRAEQIRRTLMMRLRRVINSSARLSRLVARSKQMRLRNEDLAAA
ncbi:FAD-dependent monooxygenase [Nonomuraea angiospora]|uniref:2-polyprenyl-6-methoxyphenol hydroxylase-like FAD-dependent oxidoreductase n=1 Tax=Nonomuraea angiospora TaxID=46172 RepID=A0ABR9MH14_9ACTN|nr:FAD-dependent monooxygenase [Nonomuraea angiospora]MBE1592202.1 2-polyprenyl-6-methoxyphenol hydroxylase-like FAD-dependent oxidoreductase [Nonomuraea angiospora]